jgi:O-antigen ligase
VASPLQDSSSPLLGIAKVADRAGLALLMLAALTLLFRPADLFPRLAHEPIYEVLVAACFAMSFPWVLQHLAAMTLRKNAIVLLAILLPPAVMLSHLAHLNTYEARMGGLEMAKACVLFVLVIANIRTLVRLKALLLVVTAGVLGVAVLAVLQYHEFLFLPALKGVEQGAADSGDVPVLIRLVGIGVFNDPNDFSLILVFAIFVCCFGIGERWIGWGRMVLLAALPLLCYALYLTHSRGGMLSALGGMVAFLMARYGWRNAVPLAILLVPTVLILVGGRQVSVGLDDPEDSFQTRLELWHESFNAFKSAPLLGIGQGKLAESIGQVAHNSYLHAFAELGLFGGMAFIGVFYLILHGLWRSAPEDRGLRRLRPFMLAMTVGYAAGLLSLSRCYSVPTQLVLAVAATYLALASAEGSVALPRLDWTCFRRVSGVGAAFLVATYLFVRVMLHQGFA